MANRLRGGGSPLVAGTVACVVAAGMALVPGSASADSPDGSTAAKAAPSCWAVKQWYPSSKTGLYWLKTSWLGAAQQFYCDMDTDGGGWVLVGRGRENWNFNYVGQGTPRQVRETPNGTAAFAPAALPGDTVNGLFNGGAVNEIRLRRAKNAGGTSWQDLRLIPDGLKDWSWTFDGGLKVSSAKFDGSSYGSGYTSDIDHDSIFSPYNRVWTTKVKEKGWKKGFAYGGYVSGGASNASSYLWTNSNEGSPIAFTQVYIRPKLMTEQPVSAKPATPKLLSTKTSPNPWGVTGVVGGGSGEQNIEVQGIGVLGNTVYVGGKFEYVQKGANPGPGEKVQQSYLAAFNATTGEWIPTFRPKLDGQVWDIQAAGDKIIVSGDFSNVDGAGYTTGLAALDPATGKPLSSWKASLEKTSGPRGRALDAQGGWLYVGGTFTHIMGGPNPAKTRTWVGGVARVKLTDGTPDPNWNPFMDGAVYELDASPRGDRVYLGGRFEHMGKQKETRANNFVVVSADAPGGHVAGVKDQNWIPSVARDDEQYRQTVLETTGGNVWIGGAEHDLQLYSRDFGTRITGNIGKQGGDFQDSIEINGVVYAGSHGFDFNYTDAKTWPDPTTGGYSNVHRINMLGAWDAETGRYLPNWNPGFASRAGNGIWALAKDNNGCMWVGGDVNRGSWVDNAYEWLGGFGRFCPTG